MTPVLRTPRLVLRPLEPTDAPAIAQALSDFEVVRWLTRPPHPYTEADARSFIGIVHSGEAEGPVWAITENERILGVIGTDPSLGFWLARAAQKRGIMTEAGDAVLDHAFADPARSEIETSVFEGNAASAAVLRKLGFVPRGQTRLTSVALGRDVDAVKLRLTREDWQHRRRFVIATPRLTLRELRDEDWRCVQRIASRPDVAPMLASVSLPWLDAAAQAWVRRARFHGRPGFRAAIMLGDILIGTCGIGKSPSESHQTVMYFIDPAQAGQGYATEAMHAFIAWCFDRWPELETVTADHFVDNPASGAVLRRLGFEITGRSLGKSAARLEDAPLIDYRLNRADFAPEGDT